MTDRNRDQIDEWDDDYVSDYRDRNIVAKVFDGIKEKPLGFAGESIF